MIASGNKELALLEKASREFSKQILAPNREENDKYPFGSFFQDVLDKAFALDFFHATLPEDLGGIGHGIDALSILLSNICQEDSSLGGILFTTTFAQDIILAAGNTDLIQYGTNSQSSIRDALMAYPVMVHPKEVKQLVRSKRADQNYLLSGKLEYLVLGNIADHALIPATVESQAGYSFFLINLDDQHITMSDPIFSHGLHACPAVDVTLHDVEGILVGDEEMGVSLFQHAYDHLQLATAAMSFGIMKGSLDEAMDYCSKRMQGGRIIADWSEMQMMLGDMAIKVQVAETLLSRACQAVVKKEKKWKQTVTAATLHITQAATELTTDGIQAMGGVGYMKDFGQEKRFRDAGQVQAYLGLAPLKKIAYFKQY